MNTLKFLLGTGLLTAAGSMTITAQTQPDHADANMPMGMGMMAGPIHQAVVTAFVLPEMQPELGLSPQQIAQLRDLKQEMLTKGKELSGRVSEKQKELDAMLTSGTSRGEVVKKRLEQIADLRAEQLYLGYETASKMKVDLTEPQRTKLSAMKHHELHQVMMSRMTMSDMMQMMQFMGGEGMMIGRMMMSGMMGQAMMGGGMTGGGMMGGGMMGSGMGKGTTDHGTMDHGGMPPKP